MKRDGNEYRAYTPKEITDWIARYRASGIGLRDFAAQHGLSKNRLHYWVYAKGHARLSKPPVPASLFREVKLADGLAWANWTAEVSLCSGLTVRFSAAASADWIGSVVAVLQRPC